MHINEQWRSFPAVLSAEMGVFSFYFTNERNDKNGTKNARGRNKDPVGMRHSRRYI